MNFSNTVKFLSSKFPGIIFSKESVENLVTRDKISYEAAANMVADIDASSVAGSRSSEGTNTSPVDISGEEIDKMIGAQAVKFYLRDVKIKAMLEAIKKDDTMLYTEYVNIEKARERLLAELAQKSEADFNTLLNEIKTTDGTDKALLDKLTDTACCVTEYQNKIN